MGLWDITAQKQKREEIQDRGDREQGEGEVKENNTTENKV
jgi:hypothetical protein